MHLLMPILLALATNTPLIPALTIPSTANTSPRNAVLPESTLKALAAHDALMNRSLPPCRTCDQQKRSLALPSEINPAALAQAARSLEVEEASRQLAARHFGVERREESEGCECDEATNSTASEIPGGVLYPAHFYPDICEEVKVNCMVFAPDVDYARGGIDPYIGHWWREDGTEIYAWNFYQSTILITRPGGSATTYPAHCTVYTCARGNMAAYLYDDFTVVKGDGIESDASATNSCFCSYNWGTDQYFMSIEYYEENFPQGGNVKVIDGPGGTEY